MIPKKIHYCWFGGHDLPPLQKACIKTWKKYLPDYEFIRWDESNCPQNRFIEHHLKEKNWAFVSDFVRLYALYNEGGIYLDTDFEVLKSFDDLLKNQAFVAYESETYITNGICGGVEGHKFYKDCMNYMLDRFDKQLDYDVSPVVTTNVLNTGNYGDIKIYPSSYFYPYCPYNPENDIKILMYDMIDTNTYAIHHWAKSWELDISIKRSGICANIKYLFQTFCEVLSGLVYRDKEGQK